MCGLAGYWDPRGPVARDELQRRCAAMADALARRGPDGAGSWVDAEHGIGLAHRRLAIIDPSEHGAQPMVSADGRYVLVYNGEIYDTLLLRAACESAGVRFRGHSDTEVLLETIASVGVRRAVESLTGMYAFAVWDRLERTLWLARDRLGIKPLLFGFVGREQEGIAQEAVGHIDGSVWPLLFGSQLSALRAGVPRWEPSVCSRARTDYFDVGYVPAPRTIYRGVYKLLPGHVLEIHGDGQFRRHVYWDALSVAVRGHANPYATYSQALEHVEHALRTAVRVRMDADVPLGVWLSGGIDSTLVTALMAQARPGAVHTFTVGFADPTIDERGTARNVAAHLGTRHHELEATAADALALVDELVDIVDEPFADPAVLPTVLLAKLVREHAGVALSGDGGDEVFSGYRRHIHAARIARALKLLGPAWRGKMARWIEPAARRGNDGAASPCSRPVSPADRHKLARLLAAPTFEAAYAEQLSVGLSKVDEHEPRYGERLARWAFEHCAADERRLWSDPCLAVSTYDLLGYLPDDALVKVDRASMGYGLEVRVPMLDHHVVQAASRIPSAWRVGRGQGKRLLRALLGRHVPADLAQAPKQGFAVPLAEWLRGPLADWAADLLTPESLTRAEVDERLAVPRLWAEHGAGRVDHGDGLWTALQYVAWSRRSR